MSACSPGAGELRRIARLYLASRRASRALVATLASAAGGWLLLALSPDRQLRTLVEITAPLGPAVVIGSSTWSPLGEIEDTAGRPLVLLRLLHLGGLLASAAATLALAGLAASGANTHWVLVRNLAGYTGLALIGARLQGPAFASAFCWALPVGYASLVFAASERLERTWAWAGQPASRDSALAIAVALLAIGLAMILPARNWQRASEGEVA